MKILFVTPFFPSSKVGHAGGVFIYEVVKALSMRGHEIHLLSRIEPDQFNALHEMKSFCSKVILLPFKTPPVRNLLSLIRIVCSYINLGIKANRIIKKGRFDLAQVEYLETGLMIRRTKIPMIIDAHDVITKPAQRKFITSRGRSKKILRYFIWRITKQIEKYIVAKFDIVFT